jgi:hypothetical protein
MGSLILAYSFGKNGDGEEDRDGEGEKNELVMVPLADMLNANPQLNNVH